MCILVGPWNADADAEDDDDDDDIYIISMYISV